MRSGDRYSSSSRPVVESGKVISWVDRACSIGYLVLFGLVVLILVRSGHLLRASRQNQIWIESGKWLLPNSLEQGEEHLRRLERRLGGFVHQYDDSSWAVSYLEHVSALKERHSAAAYVAEDRARYLFGQAIQYEQTGKLPEAVVALEEAVLQDERFIPAYYQLLELYRQLRALEKLDTLLARLGMLAPEYEVNQEVRPGLMLLGYDLDERQLEADIPVSITLYWQLAGLTGERSLSLTEYSGWQIYQYSSRIYQAGRVDNLVRNGGFEQALWSGVGIPNGFRPKYVPQPEDAVAQVLDYRGDGPSMVARIGPASAGLETHRIPIQPDAWYLQAAWVKTEGGAGLHFGRWWERPTKGEPTYNYAVRSGELPQWTYVSEVITSPSDSVRSEVWLLNFGGLGYFDDVFFIRLPVEVVDWLIQSEPSIKCLN